MIMIITHHLGKSGRLYPSPPHTQAPTLVNTPPAMSSKTSQPNATSPAPPTNPSMQHTSYSHSESGVSSCPDTSRWLFLRVCHPPNSLLTPPPNCTSSINSRSLTTSSLSFPSVKGKLRWVTEVSKAFYLEWNVAEVKMATATLSHSICISRRCVYVTECPPSLPHSLTSSLTSMLPRERIHYTAAHVALTLPGKNAELLHIVSLQHYDNFPPCCCYCYHSMMIMYHSMIIMHLWFV